MGWQKYTVKKCNDWLVGIRDYLLRSFCTPNFFSAKDFVVEKLKQQFMCRHRLCKVRVDQACNMPIQWWTCNRCSMQRIHNTGAIIFFECKTITSESSSSARSHATQSLGAAWPKCAACYIDYTTSAIYQTCATYASTAMCRGGSVRVFIRSRHRVVLTAAVECTEWAKRAVCLSQIASGRRSHTACRWSGRWGSAGDAPRSWICYCNHTDTCETARRSGGGPSSQWPVTSAADEGSAEMKTSSNGRSPELRPVQNGIVQWIDRGSGREGTWQQCTGIILNCEVSSK